MPPYNQNQDTSFSDTLSKFKPSMLFVGIILCALLAFEVFNYSTTDHALGDLLGNLTFIGIPWSTILALAFCGIDFAGIARLFTPEVGKDEPKEVWYLFGAWLLAATMNAILTWWGVSMAIASHPVQSSSIVDQSTINKIVPVFVAVMVWVIRILIIGTLSLALDRMLHPEVEQRAIARSTAGVRTNHQQVPMNRSTYIPQGLTSSSMPSRGSNAMPRAASPAQTSARPAARFSSAAPAEDEENPFDQPAPAYARPEPTYHNLSGRPAVNSNVQNPLNRSTGNDRFHRS